MIATVLVARRLAALAVKLAYDRRIAAIFSSPRRPRVRGAASGRGADDGGWRGALPRLRSTVLRLAHRQYPPARRADRRAWCCRSALASRCSSP